MKFRDSDFEIIEQGPGVDGGFKMIEKINVDETYDEPTRYEDVLSTLKKDGYTCNENIEK